jgi:acyl-CoA hydrolase
VDPKPVSESRAQLIRWMGITDANSAGNVHGGTIMNSRRRVVTVAMDRMNFLVPIYIGDLVTFSSMVNAAWRTSMEIGVRVDAENPHTGEVRHTNTAYLTMVALDEQADPTPVPPAVATTATEQRRMREAELRRANRLAEREQILAARAQTSAGHSDGR